MERSRLSIFQREIRRWKLLSDGGVSIAVGIAPGPDLRWHVSACRDRRIRDFERLCSLEGCELPLTAQPRVSIRTHPLTELIDICAPTGHLQS